MKRKVLSEEELRHMLLPGEGQVLGVATKLLGFDKILVHCNDGMDRLCRVRGKLKRRVWVRQGDVVLVSPWSFTSKADQGDIVWRYTRNQADWLTKNNYIKPRL
ncbi:MAG: translation initiation factor eIF-1A [Candidatus Bathyarchaeia archaeon]